MRAIVCCHPASPQGIELSDSRIIQGGADPPGARGPSQQEPDRQGTTHTLRDSSGGNNTNTSSSISAQTRCPRSPQHMSKTVRPWKQWTNNPLIGIVRIPEQWRWSLTEMKIPNAQIHSAALSNTDQNRSYHRSHKATGQITGVFRANYWLAHAHALISYTLLSTASVWVGKSTSYSGFTG